VPADEWLPELTVTIEDGAEEQALLADAVGVALLVVLEALTPAERLAFVLHDMFAVPFSEIADILDRTPEAARQLASRARRRVRGTTPRSRASVRAQRELVDAFLVAARDGDFDALVGLLAPDVVFRVRGPAVRAATVRGAEEVARRVLRRGAAIAPHARPVLVNGWPGALVGPAERPISVVAFTVAEGRIASVDVIVERAVALPEA
jgi:RNA polymerase sigma-70 factor (ECF subfamily)